MLGFIILLVGIYIIWETFEGTFLGSCIFAFIFWYIPICYFIGSALEFLGF